MNATKTDYSDYLAFAKAMALAAGEVMIDYYFRTEKGVQVKLDRSRVTEADTLINSQLIELVKAKYPDHGVMGEEESYEPTRDMLWVCDPIDGTSGFIDGIPTAMFSLALVERGVPIVAAVYDPFQKRLQSAAKGQGATLNDTPMHVSAHASMQKAKVFSVSGTPGFLKRQELFKDIMGQGAVVKIFPGNVFQSSLIAEGRAEGYLFPGTMAHDIAAIKLIVEEAGGKVTSVAGQEQAYNTAINGAIISNGLIHDDLVAAVERYGAEDYIGF